MMLEIIAFVIILSIALQKKNISLFSQNKSGDLKYQAFSKPIYQFLDIFSENALIVLCYCDKLLFNDNVIHLRK